MNTKFFESQIASINNKIVGLTVKKAVLEGKLNEASEEKARKLKELEDKLDEQLSKKYGKVIEKVSAMNEEISRMQLAVNALKGSLVSTVVLPEESESNEVDCPAGEPLMTDEVEILEEDTMVADVEEDDSWKLPKDRKCNQVEEVFPTSESDEWN